MIELEKKNISEKSAYKITVTGETTLSSGSVRNKLTGIINEKDWDDADILFFSYISKGIYCWPKWKDTKYKFGEDFKDNEIFNSYLCFWHVGYMKGCLDLAWDSIVNVKIEHIDENGVISKIKLPDIESLFATEDEFITAFEKAIAEKVKREKQSCIDEDDKYYIQPWELKKAKEILKHFGWNDKDCENMYFINNEIGFCKIETEFNIDEQIRNVRKIDIDGHIYTGFKDETFAKLEKGINEMPEIADIVKKLAIEILKKYNGTAAIDKNDYLYKLAYDEFKRKEYGTPTYNNGYNGVHIWEYDSMEEFLKFNDFGIDEESIADYGDEIKTINNKVYMIHEGD
ncbi:MAG: hypothetical protein [Wendovervirus sonii]|uniref:Uncharacterized protein n=1 Tax=phage Lak_Megaphage_Sonny TaxID=3109229 RepID=A0ABZ0Z2E7_9CAUD|nr:MAG: hypothetical protein [phage Lak_Megaphage_Sonny]